MLRRDESFDGRFVYAVRSTGIYCRPSCPSRRPSRSQVIFFHGQEPALQAGFRPCRRCRPQEKIPPRVRLVSEVCRYIEQNYSDGLNLSSLLMHFKVSASHLHRAFKRVLGVTPAQYADGCRMRGVKKRLRAGSDVTSAIYDAGLGSSSRLYERTRSDFGMTPAVYGSGGRGMRIAYTTAESPLGRLLVAATSRGLCAVTLGNSDRTLVAELKREYSEALIVEENDSLNAAVALILDHLNGSQPNIDLPLDIRATAFQRRVWDELRRIPYGRTKSYSEVAQAIDQPKAARAVARACASNPVALVIPCHRVVSATGASNGYRWGKTRKQKLLEAEKHESGKP